MARCREIQNRMQKYPGYDENHQCHVYDLLSKMRKAKKESGKYGAVFLYPSVYDGTSAASSSGCSHMYFEKEDTGRMTIRKSGLLVITADKGLAGAYNHNVLKLAQEYLENRT